MHINNVNLFILIVFYVHVCDFLFGNIKCFPRLCLLVFLEADIN